MATSQETVFREHPCFGACKNRKGRIHLPVAPGCNIECRFCDRRINEDAQVPGNTSKVIKPEDNPRLATEMAEALKAYHPWQVFYINGEYRAYGIGGYSFIYKLND